MAFIYPFRAWRYNPAAVRLDSVLTQPYDKISPAMQQAYYQSSPFNLVRIILGLPELFDAERGESVYTRAAREFAQWKQDGILVQEKTPCVFAYAQRFQVPGTNILKERLGFIALGQLHEYADQVVFRHEETLAEPKRDRLKLLQATRAHFGQVFMLYSDPASSIEAILADARSAPDLEVTDEFGVLHRLWRINDPAVINLLTTAMRDKKLIIADGHHRYETALAYCKERAPGIPPKLDSSLNPAAHPPFPEAAMMMTFINMDSDALVILPIHRVVQGLADFEPSGFVAKAREFFTLESLPASDAAGYLARLSAEKGVAFIAVTGGAAYLLKPRPETTGPVLESLPERIRQLDLSQLHAVVLEHILGLTAEEIRDETNVRYLRDAAEAMALVHGGNANIAFLIHPVTLEQLREVAFAGGVMPQKSTDFYPKLLSGLAIYGLD